MQNSSLLKNERSALYECTEGNNTKIRETHEKITVKRNLTTSFPQNKYVIMLAYAFAFIFRPVQLNTLCIFTAV